MKQPVFPADFLALFPQLSDQSDENGSDETAEGEYHNVE